MVSTFVSCYSFNYPTVPVFEKMSCRMRGRRVTIPEPRGRKSLWEGKGTEITHKAGLWNRKYDHTWWSNSLLQFRQPQQRHQPQQDTEEHWPWRVLRQWDGCEGKVEKLDGGLMTNGTPAGCTSAPACPNGPFLKYLNHLPKIPKRSVYFLHIF